MTTFQRTFTSRQPEGAALREALWRRLVGARGAEAALEGLPAKIAAALAPLASQPQRPTLITLGGGRPVR